jgi:hypothetical protein
MPVLKEVLKKYDERVWIGFICLGIGTRSGFL